MPDLWVSAWKKIDIGTLGIFPKLGITQYDVIAT